MLPALPPLEAQWCTAVATRPLVVLLVHVSCTSRELLSGSCELLSLKGHLGDRGSCEQLPVVLG